MAINRNTFLILSFILLFTGIQAKAQSEEQRLENTKALMKTIFESNDTAALSILEQGVIIDGDSPDTNPLINAIYYKMSHLISALVEKGANVNAQNKDGGTPLMAATYMGDIHTMTLLLNHAADPYKKSNSGYNSFDYAVYGGNYEIMKHLLLKYLEIAQKTPDSDLKKIENTVDRKLVDPELSQYKDVFALLALLTKDDQYYFKTIEQLGLNIEDSPYTNVSPLDIGIIINNDKIIHGLIERGFLLTKPNKMNKVPILFVDPNGQKDTYLFFMKKMLKEKAKVKAERKIVAQLEKFEIKIKKLKRLSPDFQLLLMEYAIVSGKEKTVRQLLDSGMNPNGENGGGVYFLSIAVRNNNINMATILLDGGANLHAQNKDTYQMTAFMMAASSGDVPMGKLLLKRGARINFGDVNNDPALNYAVYYGNLDFVRFLLENKADFTMKGQGGYTALKTAKAHDYKEVIALLKEYGAKE